MVLTLDLETTIHDKGSPHHPDNFVVTAHCKQNDSATRCFCYLAPDFSDELRSNVSSASLIVGVNLKFDTSWLQRMGIGVNQRTRVWDCMLAEFYLSGQTSAFAGLETLCTMYGLEKKHQGINEYWEQGISTENIPFDVVEDRGNSDVELTYQVYLHQLKDKRMTPALKKFILLAGLDMLVLADMEYNGLKYDSEASRAKAKLLDAEADGLRKRIFDAAGHRFNLNSGDQLSAYLFGGTIDTEVFEAVTKTYKSGPKKGQEYVRNEYQRTDTIRFDGTFKPIPGSEIQKSTPDKPIYQVSDDILLQLRPRSAAQRAVIEGLRRISEIDKLTGTYLRAIPTLIEERNWGGYVHGQYNQVVARTGRLSSSKPNMQNASADVDEFFITRYE